MFLINLLYNINPSIEKSLINSSSNNIIELIGHLKQKREVLSFKGSLENISIVKV